YNLVTRDIEMEFIPMCKEENLAIVVWAPLAGGFLTCKYKSNSSTNVKGRLVEVGELETDSWKRRATERNFRILEVVEEIAKNRGVTCAQVSLAWIRGKEEITAPILGARTIEQIEDNLGCLEVELNEDEMKRLDEVSKPWEPYPYEFIRLWGRK
ncbi:aldo/keto reductase, partial [Candidatus Sumerlaeota bacterium]|nr:aldo/keto reductase [Candidatus Sumerlaeota bacterium]